MQVCGRETGPLKIGGEVTPGVRTNFSPEFVEGRLGPNKFWPTRQTCRAGPAGGGPNILDRGSGNTGVGYNFSEMLM